MGWCDKSLPRFQAKHVCRIGCIENQTANNAHHKEDEKGALLEQNASLKLNRLHFEPGYKRLSEGKFKWWLEAGDNSLKQLAVHELQLLIWNGNPDFAQVAPPWRKI